MAVGTSAVKYPTQDPPARALELGNSYVLLRLHKAQAFWNGGLFATADSLVCTTSVRCSYVGNDPALSLHPVASFQKNTPCLLPLSINLTDWLPARNTDRVQLEMKFTVLQGAPLAKLLQHIEGNDLVAKVSLLKPEAAVALKVGTLAGKFLSAITGEGSKHESFDLNVDLNLADLKSGYYAVIGTNLPQPFPEGLKIVDGDLRKSNGDKLVGFSHVVLEVAVLPRRGDEVARETPWWEMLQTAKQNALDALITTGAERAEALKAWNAGLKAAREAARKDRNYLLREVNEILQAAAAEVLAALRPSVVAEATGGGELPEAWHDLLGVTTEDELSRSVAAYHAALGRSKAVLEAYGA